MAKPKTKTDNAIDYVTDPHVKAWYLANKDRLQNFEVVVNHFLEPRNGGYELYGNGLLMRPVFPVKVQKELGYTFMDIVFPRPSDAHCHADVGEAILVLSGAGTLWTGKWNGDVINWPQGEKIKPGYSIFIPSGTPHRFKPADDAPCLELRVACTGILRDDGEVQYARFDKW